MALGPIASVNLPDLKGANWYEGFRRIKILGQVFVFSVLSYISFDELNSTPSYKVKDAGDGQNILVTAGYSWEPRDFLFPKEVTDAQIRKALKVEDKTNFTPVFWKWLGLSVLLVGSVEVGFRLIVWVIRGFLHNSSSHE